MKHIDILMNVGTAIAGSLLGLVCSIAMMVSLIAIYPGAAPSQDVGYPVTVIAAIPDEHQQRAAAIVFDTSVPNSNGKLDLQLTTGRKVTLSIYSARGIHEFVLTNHLDGEWSPEEDEFGSLDLLNAKGIFQVKK